LKTYEHLFVVGAGFSKNVGLPLAADFTHELLYITGMKNTALSKALVEFIRIFVNDAFGGGSEVPPEHWPMLEDLFTTIDLSANTGHHLGVKYAASICELFDGLLLCD
jgi:hypothetical protein